MYLLTTLLSLLLHVTSSALDTTLDTTLDTYTTTLQLHLNLELLLRTERSILLQLEHLRPLIAGHEDTLYFLDFLEDDSGYPDLGGTPGEVVQCPVDRFKLVERYLYDWPVLTDMLRTLSVDINPDSIFTNTLPSLPTWSDLTRTVADINTASAIYTGEDDELSSSPYIQLNTGNYIVMTNISHSLGHITACAEWGATADMDMMAADEPFVIPGEPHWLEQYLRYYECLVEEGLDLERAGEVREEVEVHYGEEEAVILDMIDAGNGRLEEREGVIRECAREPGKLDSYCFVEKHPHNPLRRFKVERVHGHKITFYYDLISVQTLIDSSPKSGAILIVNTDRFSFIRIVTSSSSAGTLTLEPGTGVVVEVESVKTLCTPLHGISVIYSV